MLNARTKVVAPYPIVALLLLTFVVFSFIFSPVANAGAVDNPGGNASVKSGDLRKTIVDKCTLAKKKYKGNKTSSEYIEFLNACDANGGYRPGGSGLYERAKRLLVICGYPNFLKESGRYDAYNKEGAQGYRDCDVVKRNEDVNRLASRVAEYPKVSKDPALECKRYTEKCDLMKKYINPFIEFLAVFVGVAVTIGIITGGIRYAAAGDDPQKVTSAKNMIRNAIIVLIAFIFLYAAIQWMLPQA